MIFFFRHFVIYLIALNVCWCYEYSDSLYQSDDGHYNHENVQISRDGWRPMYAQQVYPEVKSSIANPQFDPGLADPQFEDDVVSYDYGSSEDEASVVVRPYEVPNQVKAKDEQNISTFDIIFQ